MEWAFDKHGPDFEARSDELVRTGPIVPILITGRTEQIQTQGLIDTGASFCAIKPRLARKLNLIVIDQKRISGVSASGFAASGDADVMMAMVGFDENYVIPVQVVAADFLRDDPSVSLLLGRPFLQHFDLHYEGACGRFKLSWTKSHLMDSED